MVRIHLTQEQLEAMIEEERQNPTPGLDRELQHYRASHCACCDIPLEQRLKTPDGWICPPCYDVLYIHGARDHWRSH